MSQQNKNENLHENEKDIKIKEDIETNQAEVKTNTTTSQDEQTEINLFKDKTTEDGKDEPSEDKTEKSS